MSSIDRENFVQEEMTIGELIHEKRIAKGITQRELGFMLGFTNPDTAAFMVSQFERDQRAIPRSRLRLASRILQIPLDRFIP